MQKYLVFAGMDYEAYGGWGDFMGDFDDLEEAKNIELKERYDWIHIVDTDEIRMILNGERERPQWHKKRNPEWVWEIVDNY